MKPDYVLIYKMLACYKKLLLALASGQGLKFDTKILVEEVCDVSLQMALLNVQNESVVKQADTTALEAVVREGV